jgi:hypothetical protein
MDDDTKNQESRFKISRVSGRVKMKGGNVVSATSREVNSVERKSDAEQPVG